MRIHTNENTMSNIMSAARMARVSLDVLESHNSKTHDAAFEVILSGASRRRQNTGKSSREREFAATWDQWGVFLAFLFHIDPDMRAGGSVRERQSLACSECVDRNAPARPSQHARIQNREASTQVRRQA